MIFETLTLRCVTRTTRAVMLARTDLRKAPGMWVPLKHLHPEDAAHLLTLPHDRMGVNELRLDRETALAKGLISPPPDGTNSLFGGTP